MKLKIIKPKARNGLDFAYLGMSNCYQCDQVAGLFVQYLAIYNSEFWPNSIKEFPK